MVKNNTLLKSIWIGILGTSVTIILLEFLTWRYSEFKTQRIRKIKQKLKQIPLKEIPGDRKEKILSYKAYELSMLIKKKYILQKKFFMYI